MNNPEFIAAGYDPASLPHRELLIDAIEKHLPFDSLLDVGSGEGADLFLCRQKWPQKTYLGIEMDPRRYAECVLRNPGLPVVCQNANTLMHFFNDSSFDIVISDASLMYNARELLDNMLRVAKKAVILMEQDKNMAMFLYMRRRHLAITDTPITPDIWNEQTWNTIGHLYEVLV